MGCWQSNIRSQLLTMCAWLACAAVNASGQASPDSVNQDELQRHTALFQRLDTNRDGVLQDGEIPQAHAVLWERLKRNADENHDGAVSATEFVKALRHKPIEESPQAVPDPPLGTANISRIFRSMDKNKDGYLEAAEIPEHRRQQFLQRFPGNAQPRVNLQQFTRAMRANETLEQRRQRFLQVVDRNQNGMVERKEVPNGLLQAFRKSDVDGNGQLEADEVREFARRARSK